MDEKTYDTFPQIMCEVPIASYHRLTVFLISYYLAVILIVQQTIVRSQKVHWELHASDNVP